MGFLINPYLSFPLLLLLLLLPPPLSNVCRISCAPFPLLHLLFCTSAGAAPLFNSYNAYASELYRLAQPLWRLTLHTDLSSIVWRSTLWASHNAYEPALYRLVQLPFWRLRI